MSAVLLSCILLLLQWAGGAQAVGPVKIFIMSGQSNMEGRASVTHLRLLIDDEDSSISRQYERFDLSGRGDRYAVRDDVFVRINEVRSGGLSAIGFGDEPEDGENFFGPDLSFGWEMGDLFEEDVLIIKTAYGGSSLGHDWRSPRSGYMGPRYEQSRNTILQTLGSLGTYLPNYDGSGYNVVGYIWFQGYADVHVDSYRETYMDNLANFIRDIRDELSLPYMPFIIGGIGGQGANPDAAEAQLREIQYNLTQSAEFRETTLFVPTSQYVNASLTQYDSYIHYFGRADAMVSIGMDFAEALLELRDRSRQPSASPSTAIPTSRPTTLEPSSVPTEMPVPTPSPTDDCDDEEDIFFVTPSGEMKNCIWLRARPEEQAILCNPDHPSGAYFVCEETCNKCSDDCEDESTFFVVAGAIRNCVWLSERPNQREVLCQPGNPVFRICRDTCDTCYVSFPPQSIPPDTQSPTPPPTTRMPTSPPLTLPPIPPLSFADTCDDSPDEQFYIDYLDQFQRCVWLADRPEEQLVLCQPNSPSNAFHICAETCRKCADNCEDAAGTFVAGSFTINCAWLSLRPTQQEIYCVPGQPAYDICQETCGNCGTLAPSGAATPTGQPNSFSTSTPTSDVTQAPVSTTPTSAPVSVFSTPAPLIVVPTPSPSTQSPFQQSLADSCDDSQERLFYVQSLNQLQRCVWLAARPEQQLVLCQPDDSSNAYNICPETCGKCSDNCDDGSDWFLVGNASRNCAWLSLRPTQQDELCVVGHQAWDICRETCDNCGSLAPTATAIPTGQPYHGRTPVPTSLIANPTPQPVTPTPIHPSPGDTCDDSTDQLFFVQSLNQIQRCIWLAARPEQQLTLCRPDDPSNAYNICEETCGKCIDTCEDGISRFLVDGVYRNCAWLSLRPGQQVTQCISGEPAWNICKETCGNCGTPAPAPPTLEPTPAPFFYTGDSCDDSRDAQFYVQSINQLQQCVWLAARPEQQLVLCQPDDPSNAFNICPETCGKCSDNCEDGSGWFLVGNASRNCAWLSLRPTQQEELCVVGHQAWDICRETCDNCGSLAPTAGTPPMQQPIVSPTPGPSLAPATSAPTSLIANPTPPPVTPSPIHPSPGDTCDDSVDEEFYVQSLNQLQRCIWLAARPEQQLTLCRPDDPSNAYNICEETCGKCLDTCEDESYRFVVDGIFRDCVWLSIRPGQQVVNCIPGEPAWDICKETCGNCGTASPEFSDPCDDSMEETFFVQSINQVQRCVWLAARPDQQATLCQPDDPSDAYNICAETCGKCSDNCEDRSGTFIVGDVIRNCAWLSLRPDQQDLFCIPGLAAWDICPETCGNCGTVPPQPVDPCDDSMVDTFFVQSINQLQRCVWLVARPDQQATLCQPDDPSDAYNICAETCGKCSDDCEDGTGRFTVENATRDCGWLSLRPAKQDLLCVPGLPAWDICRETCGNC